LSAFNTEDFKGGRSSWIVFQMSPNLRCLTDAAANCRFLECRHARWAQASASPFSEGGFADDEDLALDGCLCFEVAAERFEVHSPTKSSMRRILSRMSSRCDFASSKGMDSLAHHTRLYALLHRMAGSNRLDASMSLSWFSSLAMRRGEASGAVKLG